MPRAERSDGQEPHGPEVHDHGTPWPAFELANSWLERRREPCLTPADAEEVRWHVLERLLGVLAQGVVVEAPLAWTRCVYARTVGARRRRSRLLLIAVEHLGSADRSVADALEPSARGSDHRAAGCMSSEEFWELVDRRRDAIRRTLSPRELEVLAQVRDARSIRALAAELGLQPRAVRTLIARSGEKLRKLVPPLPPTGRDVARPSFRIEYVTDHGSRPGLPGATILAPVSFQAGVDRPTDACGRQQRRAPSGPWPPWPHLFPT